MPATALVDLTAGGDRGSQRGPEREVAGSALVGACVPAGRGDFVEMQPRVEGHRRAACRRASGQAAVAAGTVVRTRCMPAVGGRAIVGVRHRRHTVRRHRVMVCMLGARVGLGGDRVPATREPAGRSHARPRRQRHRPDQQSGDGSASMQGHGSEFTGQPGIRTVRMPLESPSGTPRQFRRNGVPRCHAMSFAARWK